MSTVENTELRENAKLTGTDEETTKAKSRLTSWIEVDVNSVYRNYDHYKFFLEEYGSRLITISKHRSTAAISLPTQWLPVALESFGFLCLENYIGGIEAKENGMVVKNKWTEAGKSLKNQGWTKESITELNKLNAAVKMKRNTKRAKDFARKYLREKQQENLNRTGRGRKRKHDATEERERGWEDACCDDLNELLHQRQGERDEEDDDSSVRATEEV